MRYRAHGNCGEDITPTRAETDADEHTPQDAWFPTGPAGSALAALLGTITPMPQDIPPWP